MNIEELNIIQIQDAFDDGEFSSKELTFYYLNRIAKYDQAGPKLNSILEINPDAVHIADALDYERRTLGPRSLLHGIPILVKDNIDTADKMHTSAGSLVLQNHYAKKDAWVIQQLRKAGAVILGKTNMTEWANFMADNMPAGYSSRGGQVKNPYGEHFTPGGSSAGSGVAVAAGLAVAAVGTETSGSILSPASQNGIVGIKPTIGMISRTGIIPISHTQDTAGPMTRNVTDAAVLLNYLQGIDQEDPITRINPILSMDLRLSLREDGLTHKRIGIARTPYFHELSNSHKKALDHSIDTLKRLGAIVVDPIEIQIPESFNNIEVMLHEFKVGIEGYLNTADAKLGIHTLADIINQNKMIGHDALVYGQQVLVKADKTSGNLTEPTYLRALENDQRDARKNGIDAVVEENNLDAILFPSYKGALLSAKAGYPSITVPSGFCETDGPIGITFTGKSFTEPQLLEIAYAYESGRESDWKVNLK